MENKNRKVIIADETIRIKINDKYDVLFRKDIYQPICVKRNTLNYILSDKENCNKAVMDKLIEKGLICEEGSEKKGSSIITSLKELRENYCDNILEIRFIPSYLCDENCGYCLARNAMDNCSKIFSISWIENLIDVTNQYLKLHNGDIDTISFTFIGGEPLLDINWNVCKEVLKEFREYFKEKIKITTRIITNGNRIDNGFLDKNSQYIDEIYLSFDIRGKINDETEPVQKKYSDIFMDLLDNCLKYVNTVTVDLKVNSQSNISPDNFILAELRKRSEIYGDKLVIAASVIVTISDYDPYSQKHVCKYELKNFKKDDCLGILKNLKLYFGKHFTFWPMLQHCSIYRCKTATNNTLMVYPSGKVSICGKLYTNISDKVPLVADLSQGSLINKKVLIDSDLVFQDEECMNCDYFFVCGGKCPLMADTSCVEEQEYAKMFIDMAALYAVEKNSNNLIKTFENTKG